MLRKLAINLTVLLGFVLGMLGVPATTAPSAQAAGSSTAELKKIDNQLNSFLAKKDKKKKKHKKHHKKKAAAKKKEKKHKKHKKHHKKKKKTTSASAELQKIEKEIAAFEKSQKN